jgi:hypothetical protein
MSPGRSRGFSLRRRESFECCRARRRLRQHIQAGKGRLRDPRSIIQGQNALLGFFGDTIPLRPAAMKPGGATVSGRSRGPEPCRPAQRRSERYSQCNEVVAGA